MTYMHAAYDKSGGVIVQGEQTASRLKVNPPQGGRAARVPRLQTAIPLVLRVAMATPIAREPVSAACPNSYARALEPGPPYQG